MASDETKIQINLCRLGNVTCQTRDKGQQEKSRIEYHATSIRKLLTDENRPAEESWPNHVKSEQHIGSDILGFSCCPLARVLHVTLNREFKGRFTRYDFVAYDKLTTGLRYELFRVNQTYNSLNGPKSCRRPVVSLSYATKSYRVNRP